MWADSIWWLGIRGLVRFNHSLLGMVLCDSNRYFMEDYSCHKTWEWNGWGRFISFIMFEVGNGYYVPSFCGMFGVGEVTLLEAIPAMFCIARNKEALVADYWVGIMKSYIRIYCLLGLHIIRRWGTYRNFSIFSILSKAIGN